MFGTVARRQRFASFWCFIDVFNLLFGFFPPLCCSACVRKTRWSRPELWATREQLLCAKKKKKKKNPNREAGSGAFFNWHKQLITTTHGCPSVSDETGFQPSLASTSKFFETEPQCLLFWAGTWCRWAVQGSLLGICLKSCRSCSN